MPSPRYRRRTAFTLIELMVVVTIIAILAALVIPALQKAQAKSMGMRCLSISRSIAASIRNYAANWNGWTNPDRESYVKEFGYRLNSEVGYFGEAADAWAGDTSSQSYQFASEKIKDFRCPVDEGPEINRHAIRTSYSVTSAFGGSNVMNMTGEANRTLAVKEVGSARHPLEGDMERSYVFADLSATLGYRGPALNGARMRVWNANTTSYRDVAESSLTAPNYEEEYTGEWYQYDDWSHVRLNGLLGTASSNDWYPSPQGAASYGRFQYPLNVTMRLDGVVKFPADGTWELCVYGNDRGVYFGISTNPHGSVRDAVDETNWDWPYRRDWGPNFTQDGRTVVKTGVLTSQHYAIQIYHYAADYAGRWGVNVRRQDGSGGYDAAYGGATGIVLPASWVYVMP